MKPGYEHHMTGSSEGLPREAWAVPFRRRVGGTVYWVLTDGPPHASYYTVDRAGNVLRPVRYVLDEESIK